MLTPMRSEERLARRLDSRLNALGLSSRAVGSGVHWHAAVTGADGRSLVVHCFWYDRDVSALMLGMNPANGRSALGAKHEPHEGAEFYVLLAERAGAAGDGRTSAMDEVIACACAWTSGASIERVEHEAPFMNRRRRAMQALAASIDPRIERQLGSDPGFEVWAYGGMRSARASGTSCGFYFGAAQLAFASNAADVPGDIAAWVLDGVTLRQLEARGVTLERHAEVLESDPARWHWLHVRDRIARPDDVLAPLAPLIAALADSQTASRFYTFSSLNWLCFSASSHYPWVGEFPAVGAASHGRYSIGGKELDLADAVRAVDAALAASTVEPFFGSRTDYDARLIAEGLARRGNSLRPVLARRGNWSEVVLERGARRCIVSADELRCEAGAEHLHLAAASVDDVVGIALRYLDDDAVSLAALAADPRVRRRGR